MTEAKITSINSHEIEFLVKSSRNGYHQTKYNRHLDAWTCTCEWYGYRGGYCRHMKEAKKLLNEINNQVQQSEKTVKKVRWEQGEKAQP